MRQEALGFAARCVDILDIFNEIETDRKHYCRIEQLESAAACPGPDEAER